MTKLADFYIPNSADATYGPQAEPDSRDFDWLAAGFNARAVRTGGAVTPQLSPDMSIQISSGTGTYDGTDFSWFANVSLFLNSSDATNPRLDLIVVSTAGTHSVVTGTAAAHPVFPDPGASKLILAAIYVPAGASSIASANIIDKRVTLSDQFILANGQRPLTANWNPGSFTIGNFDFTAKPVEIYIGDADFNASVSGSIATIHMGGGDYIAFDRSTFTFTINPDSLDILKIDTLNVYFENDNLTVPDQFYAGAPSPTTPRINFDANDYLAYDRTANRFQFVIGSTQQVSVDATNVTIGVDGSAPQLTLSAQDGVNEGGQMAILGAAANTDWTFDNRSGALRWFAGGVIYLSLSTSVMTLGDSTHHVRIDINDSTAGNFDLRIFQSGDANPRFGIRGESGATGATLQWGGGTLSPDVILHRTGADVLQVGTGDSFAVPQWMRVGSATTPTNTTAGDLTAVRLFLDNGATILDVEDDSATYTKMTAGNVTLKFERAVPRLHGLFSGVETFRITGAGNIYSVTDISAVTTASTLHIYHNDALVGSTDGLTMEQAGSGDAVIQFLLSGVRRWVVGIDNSDTNFGGDPLKISATADLANAHFIFGTTGQTLQDGYSRIGSLTTPNNTTAGDLTATRMFVNNDSNFSLQFSSSNPQILLDSGDYLQWTRSTNTLSLVIGSTAEVNYVTGGTLQVLPSGATGDSSSAVFSARATVGYDGTNGAAYLLGGSGKTTEIRAGGDAYGTSLRVVTGGNTLGKGYGSFTGAMTTPTNTTAGDFTVNRLSVLGGNSDAAFGSTTGEIVRFTGSLTDQAAGAKVFANFNPTFAPVLASSSEFRNIFVSNTIAPSTGVTMNILEGFYIENRDRSDSAITHLNALTPVAVVLDSSSPATVGTITLATVIDMRGYQRPSGTSTVSITELNGIQFGSNFIQAAGATITTLRGLYYKDPTTSTITTQVAIDIEALARATTNIGIRNASNSVQTGYARFGAVTAPSNTTNGDVNAIRLFVGADAAFTSGVTAAELVGRSRIGGTDSWLEFANVATIGNVSTPAAGATRVYTRLNADLAGATNFKTVWAKDENAFESAMSLRSRTLFPMPLTLPTAVASTALASNNTTAYVSHAEVAFPVKVNKLLYNVSGAGNAANVVRIAIYSENGTQKYIDATDAVGASTGVRTIDITDTTLAPGVYLVLICHSTFSTTPCSVSTYTTDTTLTAHIASEPDLGGTLTVTAGAAPATIDPTALTTVAPSNKMPVLRLLGTALGS